MQFYFLYYVLEKKHFINYEPKNECMFVRGSYKHYWMNSDNMYLLSMFSNLNRTCDIVIIIHLESDLS